MFVKVEISRNFNFAKAKGKVDEILEARPQKIAKESARNIKDNILKGLNPPLTQTTIDIRQKRGQLSPIGAGKKPLIATGELFNSIKDTKKGIKMKKYGIYHHEGFKTGSNSMIPNVKVPARPFIFPSAKDLFKITKTIVKDINKAIKQRKSTVTRSIFQ